MRGTRFGSRPPLPAEAGAAPARVMAVGGDDTGVIEVNEEALRLLATPCRELVLVPGATHLFEEPGALDQVARHAADWFDRFLVPATEAPQPPAG